MRRPQPGEFDWGVSFPGHPNAPQTPVTSGRSGPKQLAEEREVNLKSRRKPSRCSRNGSRSAPPRSGVFLFCEKETGAPRFKVPAGEDGRLPIDQAASLLAMHCLVRGQNPKDYMVMVAAEDSRFQGVASRAEALLEASRAIVPPVRLSRREEEVLRGVLQNLSNKEIAARLFLSERTVKFHVSSLLAKFRVQGRVGLMREATNLFGPWGLPAIGSLTFPLLGAQQPSSEPAGRLEGRRPRVEARVVRMPRRRLSA